MTIPQRLQQALQQQKALADKGIHLLPIRHHSPACAITCLPSDAAWQDHSFRGNHALST